MVPALSFVPVDPGHGDESVCFRGMIDADDDDAPLNASVLDHAVDLLRSGNFRR